MIRISNVYDIGDMHKFRGKAAIIVATCIIAVIVIIFSIVLFSTNHASKADTYNLSGDIIPSMKSVVGQRKITGVSTNIGGGIEQKEYTYVGVSNVIDDLFKYMNYLGANEGFITTQDYDLTKPTGKIQLGKQAKDEGEIILINIEYYLGGYKITIEKGVGQIRPKEK